MALTIKTAKAKTTVKSALESEKVLLALQKQHGEQVAVKGGKFSPVPRIPLGIFPFDLATGGGIPRSRLTVFTGPESSGKSLNMYMAMVAVQRMGETAVLIDGEHAWDGEWGKAVGIDVGKLIVVQPSNAEQCVDAVEAFLYAKDVGIVGVDSVSAMVTENEIKSEAGKMIVAGSAMMVTKMMHKAGIAFTEGSKVGHLPSLLCISQTRYEIGKLFGDPEKMTGGQCFKFTSSLTCRFYGKNVVVEEVNKSKPTFKHVQGVIKKYKCPIVGTAFEFNQCILPHRGLGIGQVESWNTVEAFLKAQGQLVKGKTNWLLFGQEYKTLDLIKTRCREDYQFRTKCESAVAEMAVKIDTEPETKTKPKAKVDKATGEIVE